MFSSGSTDIRNLWYNDSCQDTYMLCYHVNRTLGAASACPGRPAQQAAPGVLYFVGGLPTMRCKSCLKCYHAVNESGICERCQKSIDRNKLACVFQQTSEKRAAIYKHNGKLLTRAEWLRYRRWTDNYYASVSDDDIEAYNDQVSEKIKSKPLPPQAGYIYLIESSIGYYKIGKAINVEVRRGQHLRDYPLQLTIAHAIHVEDRHRAERYLLNLFADKQLQGEWFKLSEDDVRWIMSLSGEELSILCAKSL